MTRFEALNIAAGIVEKSKRADKREIVEKLEQCMKKLSKRKWTEEKIIAYCDEIVKKKGRLLMSDLSIAGAPSRGDIACAFRMTAREFRDMYYPLQSPLAPMSKYFYRTAEEWTALFIQDYNRIQPKTLTEYNKRRGKGLPRANVIAQMNGLSSWRDLLVKVGLKQSCHGEITSVYSTYPSLQALIDFDARMEAEAAA